MNQQDFPWIMKHKNIIFFDNAASSHKPSQVIDMVTHFYQSEYAPVHRGIYATAEQATSRYEEARKKVATFINARNSTEIIFVKGATEAINFIAATWGLEHIQKGDEIVLTQMEHHANLLPWQWVVQQKQALLRYIPVTQEGVLDVSGLSAIITNNTKLVAVVSTSNALGTHNDLAPIIAQARNVGAKTLVDACQSVPHQKTDVQKLNCDFLVFSGHKMMGPTGIGVLYIKKELHNDISPYQRGGGMVRESTFQRATWLDAPQKFEAGTPPIAQAIGLGAAIDYYTMHIDFNILQKHETELTKATIQGLSSIPKIRLLGPIHELQQLGHSVTFIHEKYHPHDIAAFLDAQGVCVRAGHFCVQPLFNVWGMPAGAIRVSFFCYNTFEEVERFLTLIKKLS